MLAKILQQQNEARSLPSLRVPRHPQPKGAGAAGSSETSAAFRYVRANGCILFPRVSEVRQPEPVWAGSGEKIEERKPDSSL